MKPLIEIGSVVAADGSKVVLYEHDKSYQIRVDGHELMNSRQHGSEEILAIQTVVRLCGRLAPKVLIGGLGMGFTLRAALDELEEGAEVVVAELFEAVVEWNRGPLSHLAAHPLRDDRVEVFTGDVREMLERRFDAIMLDVDNGPSAFTISSNEQLYSDTGLKRLRGALTDGGVLSLWSSYPDERFEKRLARAGFTAETQTVRARRKKGAKHTLFFGVKR